MLEEKPNSDIIERAEDLILRLREVQSARIYADEQGTITEIHVVAVTDRAPKLIARDVEGCLKAALGIAIDYRKIGVVVIQPGKEPYAHAKPQESAAHVDKPEPAPIIDLDHVVEEKLIERPAEKPQPIEAPAGEAARLEFLENDARVRFKGLRVVIEEDRLDAEVRLAKGALEVVGSQGDFRGAGRLMEIIAGAAVHAISELLEEDIRLCLSGIGEVDSGGRATLCAVVNAIDGRSVTSYAGCAFIGEEQNESAVLAVLNALNRPLGTWKLRTRIHYEIR